MPDLINFPFQVSYMSLKDQLESQIAQLNCSLATQVQSLEMFCTNPPAWPRVVNWGEIHSTQTYCCESRPNNTPKKTNCINCGATLGGKHKCSYCDTYNE